ncbi:carbohydrate kinase family domain protein [Neisseria meningitidis NM3042]|nr:carbohydrate kinase family domain protein [Neisseria meningitidis NM3042]
MFSSLNFNRLEGKCFPFSIFQAKAAAGCFRRHCVFPMFSKPVRKIRTKGLSARSP